MRALASDPNVEYVEPDVPISVSMVPNDPQFGTQWYLHSNLPPENGKVGVRAEPAWDTATGAGSVIAIVDNGVTSHNDYNANLLLGQDFVDDRTGKGMNPGNCGGNWHGTHVTGIAVALTNNGNGIAGIAFGAKAISARVMNPCGSGFMSDAADGITWAAGGAVPSVPTNNNPATVINLSLAGSGQCSATFQNAIDFATSRGSIVVAGAGNSSADVSGTQPANCHNVIAVGGTAGIGESYISSNFGPGIDIAAPGNNIWSTWDSGNSVPGGDDYRYLSGTSMSTPMVSGVIALAQSVAPKPLTVAEYRALLQQSVQPWPAPPDRLLGPGILDATQAVLAANSGSVPVAADFTCSQADGMMQVTCTDRSTARGGVSIASWSWNLDVVSNPPDMVRTSSVNPYVNYEYPGTYTVRLIVKGANGATSSVARPIQVVPPATVAFTANVPTPTSPNQSAFTYYQMNLPAGLKSLTVSIDGSSPNGGFLYLKNSPTTINPDCVTHGLPSMSCTVSNPPAGTYYAIYSSSDKAASATMTYQ